MKLTIEEILEAINGLSTRADAIAAYKAGLTRNAELRQLAEVIADAGNAEQGPNELWYVEAAQLKYGDEGTCEIDDDAVVSNGCDPGAYVLAWVWIYKPTADTEVTDVDEDEEENDFEADHG